jgi:hypothetical protein
MRLFSPTPLLPLGLVLLSAHAFDLTKWVSPRVAFRRSEGHRAP